ncbi:hypothetical protein [Maribacter thermophilus]|uniref:hypothetical protein n=1 Tax=Maribacter thermophilus TaxID=1197874 RepID=UPI000640EF78|nr:hypothetical protein [Maribacter thermophilus]
MQKNIIGYGSIFHKEDATQFTKELDGSFMGEHQLFYAGRYAIKHIIHGIAKHKEITNIWLPNYYCPFVKNWLEQEFNNIKYYDVDPFKADTNMEWSSFSSSDVVLANNYWGIKQYTIPQGKRPTIIEDHSHGWLSKGCVESKADFCIASLRKTIPIPLGGIAWKPKDSSCSIPMPLLENKELNAENPMVMAWNYMDKAMTQKAVCEHQNQKEEFLSVYGEGEMLLRNTQAIYPLQKQHEAIIRTFLFKDYNAYKKRHLALIEKKLTPSNMFKVVSAKNNVPFGLLIAFKDRAVLCSFKKHLISNDIYPAELWPQNQIAQEYKYLLNIHVDYRYNKEDMSHFAEIINKWEPQTIFTRSADDSGPKSVLSK